MALAVLLGSGNLGLDTSFSDDYYLIVTNIGNAGYLYSLLVSGNGTMNYTLCALVTNDMKTVDYSVIEAIITLDDKQDSVIEVGTKRGYSSKEYVIDADTFFTLLSADETQALVKAIANR